MNAETLFTHLRSSIPDAIEAEFGKRDCCILATRLAIEVARAFGIEAEPAPVRVVLFNSQFAKHALEEDDADIRKWEPIDGSYSVGIGYGFHDHQRRENRWDGHLIAVSDNCFADFSIQQAERPMMGIVTGPAVIGALPESLEAWSGWQAVNEEFGTVIQYKRVADPRYRSTPDWKDEQRRRKLAGPLIRRIRQEFA